MRVGTGRGERGTGIAEGSPFLKELLLYRRKKTRQQEDFVARKAAGAEQQGCGSPNQKCQKHRGPTKEMRGGKIAKCIVVGIAGGCVPKIVVHFTKEYLHN